MRKYDNFLYTVHFLTLPLDQFYTFPFFLQMRMYIHIQRCIYGRMPQNFADAFVIAATFDAAGRKGMPETMKIQGHDFMLFQKACVKFPEGPRLHEML